MLTDDFEDEEILYRRLPTKAHWWNYEKKTLSSAAFKDSKGVSADRQGSRVNEEVIDFIVARYDNIEGVVSLTNKLILSNRAKPKYDKLEDNDYHCLILNLEDESFPLKNSVATALSRLATICHIKELDLGLNGE